YITTLAKQGLVRGLPRLKFQKGHLSSACAQGKSQKHSHKPKAEDSIQEKLYLLHIDLYRPMGIQSINGQKYILVIVDDYSRSGPEPQLLTPGTLSSGLVPNLPPPTPYVPPNKKDYDTLFQPMFDEYFNTPPRFSNSYKEFYDIEVAHLDNDPSFGVPIPEPNSEESSSRDVIPINVHSINQPPEHLSKWIKDHPLDNVIGNPSRPVFTRHQLQNEALFCYFDAFLSFVEPKNYK
ncbi:hypothetical protein Tco_0960809, partial [Tanacetum coccineum]